MTIKTRLPRIALAVTGLAAFGSIALSVAGAPGWAQGDMDVSQKVAPSTGHASGQIERGRYIATAADCIACHTAPGGAPFAGGLALKTPFGALLSSNITSDSQTGIGGWTQAKFDAALRKGEGRNGHLYPAMPYTAYTRMSDADVADLWAYMRTVAPVSHKVDENQLPFPFSMRSLLFFWNLLFFDEGRFKPDPKASPAVNRGAYLSEALEHCGSCHTPMNFLGSAKHGHLFEGATLQDWHAPDLTNNGYTGLGTWSAGDIATYLRSGTNRMTGASGPMEEAIVNSTQHLNDADLAALAAYLKALPPRAIVTPPALPSSDASVAEGRTVYRANCIACHVSTGAGIKGMIPTLSGNPAIVAKDSTSLLHVLLKGTHGTATDANPTGAGMPRFDWKLDDRQIAAVVTYVRNSWGNAAPAVTEKEVAGVRKVAGGQITLISRR